jgi:hypothetical protein
LEGLLMDLLILRKKIDGFRSGNGQLQNVPPELLLDLRQAWEHFTGSPEEFRRELGMKIGTLRKLLVDSKKLNHVLASSDAVGLSEVGEQTTPVAENGASLGLELVYDGGNKVIRFPNIDTLVEFLRKAS